jgi:two-component system response regulator RegA
MGVGETSDQVERHTVRKLLLVDDDELLLKYTAREFVREGIAVSTAGSLEGALAHVRRERHDTAIIDLFLVPPDDGIVVTKALKAHAPDMYVALVSAHMSVAHTLEAIRAGANDVYVKPYTAKQALQRIAGVRDKPSLSTPTLSQIQWEHISRVLQDHDGNITHAAQALGIYRQSLQRKLNKRARPLRGEPGDPASDDESDD